LHRKFDRVFDLSQAVSTFEEAHVAERTKYLIAAVLLTVLDVAAAIDYSSLIWTAWQHNNWDDLLLILTAGQVASSLANLWVQSYSAARQTFCDQLSEPVSIQGAIAREARGQADV
jgi:hypothetical protein